MHVENSQGEDLPLRLPLEIGFLRGLRNFPLVILLTLLSVVPEDTGEKKLCLVAGCSSLILQATPP
jgi:hypothetical protein